MTEVRIDMSAAESGDNPFIKIFGSESDAKWLEAMIASLQTQRVNGVLFPSFPPEELQARVHGHGGEHALREAFGFYSFVKNAFEIHGGSPLQPKHRLLDFGSGWGRIVRFFMRDIDQRNLFAYEPNAKFCRVARLTNPYVSFIHGSFEPPSLFANATFDVLTSWSVFSHLPADLTQKWLTEFARIVVPGGVVVATFWGMRFIERLRKDKSIAEGGGEIHWYAREVLNAAAGDLDALERRVRSGEHCFLGSGAYGEAFVSREVIARLAAPYFEVIAYNDTDIAQDVAVLRRRRQEF